MNITTQIANKIGGALGEQIKNTSEIQFYANSTSKGYQWRDGRFIDKYDVWGNLSFHSSEDLIEHVLNHLSQNPINL